MLEVPDFSHPDAFEKGFPHELFRRLRREAPVCWHEGDYTGGPGYWIVSRHETIKAISRQPERFSSASGTSIEDRGDVDVAAELPLRVIADLLGVPQSACHDIFEWSNKMIGNQDPEYRVTELEAVNAAQEMYLFANSLAEDRLATARDDLMSALLHGEMDGNRLTTREFDVFFLLLAVAGNETTRNLISHGLLLLLEHPEALARLRREPALLPRAIEEMLRFRPPVITMARTALEATELEGSRIRKGDKLMLYYPSANRDGDVFEDPDVFDIDRVNNPHLAFGIGEHFCIGTHLARLETRVMFEGILERLRDIELVGPVSYLRSNLIDGVKHIPIAFTGSP